MKFLKKVFSKNEHEMSLEEQEKFNSMMGYEEKQDENPTFSQNGNNVSLESIVANLKSIDEINRFRNLLDKKEEEMENGSDFLVGESIKAEKVPIFESKKTQAQEQNVQENITEDDLNNETQEVSDVHSEVKEEIYPEIEEVEQPQAQVQGQMENKSSITEIEGSDKYESSQEVEFVASDQKSIDEATEDDFVEISEDSPVNTIVQTSEFEMKTSLFKDEVLEIFGEENIFTKIEEKSEFDILRGKKVFHVGIRQKEGFSEQSDSQSENTWFVSHIKQLDSLKEFKMVRSNLGIKDLVWDLGDFAILVSFRATNLLTAQNEFDFNL